jgi:hypothetical protein
LAGNFPDRKPEHYLFPAEKYGAAGDDFKPCSYATDPTQPIGDWKEAWGVRNSVKGLAPRPGLEPGTLRLTVARKASSDKQ